MTAKGDARKARQAAHAAREALRLAAGDVRTAAERAAAPRPKARRVRRQLERRPVFGSAAWAETYGDDLPEGGDR